MNARVTGGLVVACLTFALACAALCFGIGYFIPLGYHDFIPSDAAWRASGKAADMLTAFGSVTGFSLSLYFLQRWRQALATRSGDAAISAFDRLLALSLIPFAFWAGCQFLSATAPSFAIIGLAALALCAGLLTFARSVTAMPEQAGHFAARAFWIAPLLLLAALVPCYLRSRFGWDMKTTVTTSSLLLSCAGAVTLWHVFRGPRVQRALAFALVTAQLLLLGYYAALLPSPLTMDGVAFAYPTTPLLRASILILIMAGMMDLWRRGVRYRSQGQLDLLLSPLCLAGLLVALALPVSPAPAIFADDYHHGEHLVPFWMMAQHHALPYADIALAHGFADDFLSAVSARLFLSGHATEYYAAGQIGRGFLRILFFLSAVPVLGLPFAFLAGLLSAGLQPWYMLALTYLFLIYRLRTQRIMVPFALIGGYAIFLGWPGLGAALLLALAVPLLLWRFAAHETKASLLWAGGSAAMILLSWLVFPTSFQITFAALRYVLENGAVNLEAYGIPWYASWNDSPQKMSGAMFEAIRFSWLLLPALAFLLWNTRILTWKDHRDPILLLGFGSVFLVLIASYSLGRIDPGYMFRAGQASMVALILIGWVALPHATPGKRPALLACLALWAALFTAIPQDPFAQIWQGFRDRREGAPLTDFASHGLPWIGTGVADPKHLARIEEVKKIVDAVADENETFLDLTNRTALYFYLQRPMPIEAAPYNQPNRAMQMRSVARLDANPPPLVLLAADGFQHDGRSVAMRAPWIYRWVIERYTPVRIGNLIVGVRPDRLNRLSEHPQDAAALWDETFRVLHLDRLPVAWGHAAALEARMERVAELAPSGTHDLIPTENGFSVSGPAPEFTFTLPASLGSGTASGTASGLFAFELACTSRRAAPLFDLRWQETEAKAKPENSVRFQGAPGRMIVPLDAMPRFWRATELQALTLSIVEGGGCENFTVNNAGLYRRLP